MECYRLHLKYADKLHSKRSLIFKKIGKNFFFHNFNLFTKLESVNKVFVYIVFEHKILMIFIDLKWSNSYKLFSYVVKLTIQ